MRHVRIPALALLVLLSIAAVRFTSAAELTADEKLKVPAEWMKTWKPAAGDREKGAPLFVSVDGKESNAGTKDAPCDIASALGGAHAIAPGSTLWLTGGVYKNPKRGDNDYFTLTNLKGTAEKPIHISAVRGERVVLDGGLLAQTPLEHVWVWDLEIVTSENFTQPRVTQTAGSNVSFNRPAGGLNIMGGKHCKYIDLIIRDNTNGGCGFWTPAEDSDLYGCIIYDNGTAGPDRTHGHCVYAQNKDGTKIISNCIFSVAKEYGCYSMHAYGSSKAFVQNFIVEQNITYDCEGSNHAPFLVGGGTTDFNIVVRNNLLNGCSELNVGAHTKANQDCTVTGNFIVNGDLKIQKYDTANVSGNHVINGVFTPTDVKTLNAKENTVVPKAPDAPVIFVLPNAYDAGRAHVAIYNFKNEASVRVDVSTVAKSGHFRLLDPKDYFGKPVLEGDIADGRITVPMKGSFRALVLACDK
jgi:hypothetical protein